MRTLVQFCPCGHTSEMTLTAEVESQLRDRKKLDAPILPSSKCPQCEADAAECERQYDLLDM